MMDNSCMLHGEEGGQRTRCLMYLNCNFNARADPPLRQPIKGK